jgi:hypothetical protein
VQSSAQAEARDPATHNQHALDIGHVWSAYAVIANLDGVLTSGLDPREQRLGLKGTCAILSILSPSRIGGTADNDAHTRHTRFVSVFNR